MVINLSKVAVDINMFFHRYVYQYKQCCNQGWMNEFANNITIYEEYKVVLIILQVLGATSEWKQEIVACKIVYTSSTADMNDCSRMNESGHRHRHACVTLEPIL